MKLKQILILLFLFVFSAGFAQQQSDTIAKTKVKTHCDSMVAKALDSVRVLNDSLRAIRHKNKMQAAANG